MSGLVDPPGWEWGVSDGKIVRKMAGEVEEVPADELLGRILAKSRKPPEKSVTDRSYELLFHWIACNVRPTTVQSDTEELAREAVRWTRALEAEAETATERPPEVARSARRRDEEEF